MRPDRNRYSPRADRRTQTSPAIGWRNVAGATLLGLALVSCGTSEAPPPSPPDAERQERIARLQALGYVAGMEEAPPVIIDTVREVDPKRSSPGPILYTSGHAAEARLIDTHGVLLNRWTHSPKAIWPALARNDNAERLEYFRWVHAYDNGNLLVIYEGYGIALLDLDSNVVWARANGAHHAAEVQLNGNIFVLTRSLQIVPEISASDPVLGDFVVELDEDGTELRRVSVIRALLRAEDGLRLIRPDKRLPERGIGTFQTGDVLHTNAIRILTRDYPVDPVFRLGSALLSSAHLSAVFLMDLQAERVVWFHKADYLVQHEPTLVEEDHLLLFDNNTRERGSRALEIDLGSGAEVWQYPKPGETASFFSYCCGSAARLDNGNTLVVNTGQGRILEVAENGDVVWEFNNPERLTEQDSVIAAIFHAERLPAGFGSDWSGR
jgi:hypothetical protein